MELMVPVWAERESLQKFVDSIGLVESFRDRIWGQCKPTNYQYWNFDRMLHVYYVPSPAIDRRVRKALGVAEKVRDR
jgi:hypothetical protein